MQIRAAEKDHAKETRQGGNGTGSNDSGSYGGNDTGTSYGTGSYGDTGTGTYSYAYTWYTPDEPLTGELTPCSNLYINYLA